MLTNEQKKWVAHLSDNPVKIVPYNAQSKAVFSKVKKELHTLLGDVEILHTGSSALGISGKGEIDIHIPVPVEKFNYYVDLVKKAFGKPGSFYPLQRARFNQTREGILIEIFIMNKDTKDLTVLFKFEKLLREDKYVLSQYEKMKEQLHGATTKEYYRQKLEFMNEVLKNLI